jgi:hypothetical protein
MSPPGGETPPQQAGLEEPPWRRLSSGQRRSGGSAAGWACLGWAAAASGADASSGRVPGLGFAYLFDGGAGEQAAQAGGHRAVGELAEAGSVVADHYGGCAPGPGGVGERLGRG